MKDIVLASVSRSMYISEQTCFSVTFNNLAWTENNLPSLNWSKAIDTVSVHSRDGKADRRY